MNQVPEKPKINKHTVDPYSARILILNLEQQYNISIRVYEGDKYCNICIDKEDKEDGS